MNRVITLRLEPPFDAVDLNDFYFVSFYEKASSIEVFHSIPKEIGGSGKEEHILSIAAPFNWRSIGKFLVDFDDVAIERTDTVRVEGEDGFRAQILVLCWLPAESALAQWLMDQADTDLMSLSLDYPNLLKDEALSALNARLEKELNERWQIAEERRREDLLPFQHAIDERIQEFDAETNEMASKVRGWGRVALLDKRFEERTNLQREIENYVKTHGHMPQKTIRASGLENPESTRLMNPSASAPQPADDPEELFLKRALREYEVDIKDPSWNHKQAFIEYLDGLHEAFESIRMTPTPQVSKLRITLLQKYLRGFNHLSSVLESLGRVSSMSAIKEICFLEEQIYGLGSTTIIPRFVEAYANVWPEYDRELCSWLIDKTTNRYVPFGSLLYSHEVSSWAEKKLLSDERQARKAHFADHIGKSNEFRKSVKQGLTASKATRDLPAAIRRGDLPAIKSLLEKGADTDRVRESIGPLQALAQENERPLVVEFLKSIDEI